MTELTLTDIKVRETNLLKEFKKICEVNNIRYFLAYGTLLGGVRHKGFIPWDDDIDILMPRPDYEKLIKIFSNINNNDIEMLLNERNDLYIYPFIKLIDKNTIVKELDVNSKYESGVWIDIFPLDGLPYSDREINKFFEKILFYKKILGISLYNKHKRSKNIFKTIIKFIFIFIIKLIGNKYWLKQITKLAKKYEYEGSQFIANCTWPSYGTKEIMNRKIFDETIKVIFEKEEYDAPKEYCDYLTQIYGDYMQLPPIDKRKTNHNIIAFKK